MREMPVTGDSGLTGNEKREAGGISSAEQRYHFAIDIDGEYAFFALDSIGWADPSFEVFAVY